MSITFLHTADWQIGKPFQKFPDEVRARLKEARFDAIDRIAACATAADAAHVLVAGDVFDHAKPPREIVYKLQARLAAHPRLTWHLLPGNHDPAQPGGVWDDFARKMPANIVLHTKPEPVQIAPGVVLIPAPLAAKTMVRDPTQFMDAVVTPPGTLRIGMAHGSIQGFGSEGEAAIPIDKARAQLARLDYLALGDWHGQQKINERTWYSGTPEPDGYKDNGPGYVLVVTINGAGSVPAIRAVATHHFRWSETDADITSADDVTQLGQRLGRNGMPGKRQIVQLRLSGRVTVAEWDGTSDQLDQLAASFAHLAFDRHKIVITTGPDDLASFGGGSLRSIAQSLSATVNSGGSAEQETAKRALRRLYQFARAAR